MFSSSCSHLRDNRGCRCSHFNIQTMLTRIVHTIVLSESTSGEVIGIRYPVARIRYLGNFLCQTNKPSVLLKRSLPFTLPAGDNVDPYTQINIITSADVSHLNILASKIYFRVIYTTSFSLWERKKRIRSKNKSDELEVRGFCMRYIVVKLVPEYLCMQYRYCEKGFSTFRADRLNLERGGKIYSYILK
jgi:hypothetical protein